MAATDNGHILASVINANDGWVSHASRSLSLLAKAGLKVWVIRKVGLKQFDCNRAAKAGVDTLVNIGHATTTDEVSYLIAACNYALV